MTVDNPESLHTMARQAQVVDWVAGQLYLPSHVIVCIGSHSHYYIFTAGCLTLLLYDHFVTFGQEVCDDFSCAIDVTAETHT